MPSPASPTPDSARENRVLERDTLWETGLNSGTQRERERERERERRRAPWDHTCKRYIYIYIYHALFRDSSNTGTDSDEWELRHQRRRTTGIEGIPLNCVFFKTTTRPPARRPMPTLCGWVDPRRAAPRVKVYFILFFHVHFHLCE